MKLPYHAIPGPEIEIAGVAYRYFGGTSYLGLQTDPGFLDRMAHHVRQMGSHWGASRAGHLELTVYARAEAALASWLGSPACLTLSSGFLAARLLPEYFSASGYRRFFSPNCHEALLPAGCRRSPDWETLYREVHQHVSGPGGVIPVVFTDSVGGPAIGGPAWEQLDPLPRQCILVADDSHGLGISGPEGSGSWKPLAAKGFRELLLSGSLGKAMGVTAGVIAGPADRLADLRQTPYFSGASPAPPAGLATLTEGLENGWYRDRFRRLQELLAYFQEAIADVPHLSLVPGYPVITFRQPALAKFLRDNRVLITDFEYKAEAGASSPSRIVITAAHQVPQLRQLVELLHAFQGGGRGS